jgi:hypothetical protein
MQIRKAQFQRLTLLLVLAFLLLPSLSYAAGDDKRIRGEGTFSDRKGSSAQPPGEDPGPVLKSVTLRIPGTLEGPGGDFCDVQENGVCEVDLEKAGLKDKSCDEAIGLFVFGRLAQGEPPFDVICITDITIDFTGLFSGPALLHDTFAVYGDGSGGYFNGPAICDCTITNPTNGEVLGRGRVDFFPNEGTFGGDFFGSGGFRINRAYGELEGLTGSGTFEGVIGEQGTYKAVIQFP